MPKPRVRKRRSYAGTEKRDIDFDIYSVKVSLGEILAEIQFRTAPENPDKIRRMNEAYSKKVGGRRVAVNVAERKAVFRCTGPGEDPSVEALWQRLEYLALDQPTPPKKPRRSPSRSEPRKKALVRGGNTVRKYSH